MSKYKLYQEVLHVFLNKYKLIYQMSIKYYQLQLHKNYWENNKEKRLLFIIFSDFIKLSVKFISRKYTWIYMIGNIPGKCKYSIAWNIILHIPSIANIIIVIIRDQ